MCAPQFSTEECQGDPKTPTGAVLLSEIFFSASHGVIKVLGGKKDLLNEITPVTFFHFRFTLCICLKLSRYTLCNDYIVRPKVTVRL